MGDLPTGTVTFLLTDVEGSTRLWQERGDMGVDVAALERATVHAVEAHRGEVVKSRGEGDSSFAVFRRASDAVAAALELQLDVRDGPLRVRIAVHTGEAELRDGDYYGTTVNRCARVRESGHGGQTLVSDTTAVLVRDALPAESYLDDLGTHRLRDLARPERIHELRHPDLPARFRPLRTLDVHPNNLPAQLTTFVGRHREIAHVREMLAGHRLVTLTGVGGCGKTRLALQVAAAELDAYPDGVYFADLSTVTDASLVDQRVATAVGAAPSRRDVFTTLARGTSLVVLDNCEHLVDACADLAAEVLVHCPSVKIVVTSRESLGVDGERAWTVPSLQPDEARELFLERAATHAEEQAVAQVCERLDGIPLAIELAAAQTSHLSASQIAERLDDRFSILTGARRRVQRQQTLHAAMDWSYDLLSEPERVVLQRLAVFSGPFTLEAAEGVCAVDGVEPRAFLGLLRSLVTKSLVDAVREAERVRYRLLETVRIYAEARLVSSGEATTYRDRHRDWYLAWAESHDNPLTTAEPVHTAVLVSEHANIRAGVVWSLARDRFDLAARLAVATGPLWSRYPDETAALLSDLHWRVPELPLDLRIRYLAGSSAVAVARLDPSALQYAVEAIDLAAGDPSIGLAQAHQARGLFHLTAAVATNAPESWAAAEDDAEAVSRVIASLGLSGSPRAYGNYLRAMIAMFRGDLARGAAVARDAVPLVEGFAFMDAAMSGILCAALHLLGEHEEATATARRSLDLQRRDRAMLGLGGWATSAIAAALAGAGRRSEALEALAPSVAARQSGAAGVREEVLVGLGVLSALDGEHERAGRLLAAAGASRSAPSAWRYALARAYVRIVRDALGPERARAVRAEGAAMGRDEAMAYAVEALGG